MVHPLFIHEHGSPFVQWLYIFSLNMGANPLPPASEVSGNPRPVIKQEPKSPRPALEKTQKVPGI